MLFGASTDTLPYAMEYLNIYVIGTVCVMISLGLNPFISAQGYAKISMMTVLIGAIVNIVLDPIFIFGLNMGVKGAALATILSQAASCTWVLLFLTGKTTILKLKLKNLNLKPSIVLPCVALGAASFIMQSTESVISVCFNSSLLKYGGDMAVGAMTILTSLNQLVTLPLTGICMGGQPVISYNYGAGKAQRVREAFFTQFVLCVSYAALFWVAMMAAMTAVMAPTQAMMLQEVSVKASAPMLTCRRTSM